MAEPGAEMEISEKVVRTEPVKVERAENVVEKPRTVRGTSVLVLIVEKLDITLGNVG